MHVLCKASNREGSRLTIGGWTTLSLNPRSLLKQLQSHCTSHPDSRSHSAVYIGSCQDLYIPCSCAHEDGEN